MGNKKLFVLSLVVLLFVSFSQAAVKNFDSWGYETEGAWNSNDNWVGGIPVAFDWAVLRETIRPQRSNKTFCLISEGIAAEAYQLQVGSDDTNKAQPITLEMTGGSLTLGAGSIYGDLRIGAFAGVTGIVNISGGVIESNHDLILGEAGTGIMNVSGDSIVNVARATKLGLEGGTGVINLEGGTLNTGEWAFSYGDTDDIIDIKGGILTFQGDVIWKLENLWQNNIIAYGGTGTLIKTYDSETNITTVTASSVPPCVPEYWQINGGGNISLSSDHFKQGAKSVRWDWVAGSELFHTQADLNGGTGIVAWVYNEVPLDANLSFWFGVESELNAGNPYRKFDFNLNFSGWRAIWVHLYRDAINPDYIPGQSIIDRMIINAPDVGDGTIFIGACEFTTPPSWSLTADRQLPFLNENGDGGTHKTLYYSQLASLQEEPEQITQVQIDAFDLIADRYEKWILGGNFDLTKGPISIRYTALVSWIQSAYEAYDDLNIVSAGNNITGCPLFAQSGGTEFNYVFKHVLLPLSVDYRLSGKNDTKDKILKLFDYLHDQGWAAGSGLGSLRLYMLSEHGYFNALFLMREELAAAGILQRELETANWYSAYGQVYENPETPGENCDYLRSYLQLRLLYVLSVENCPEKIVNMDEFLRWANNAFALTTGWSETIKTDFSCCHHGNMMGNSYIIDALNTMSTILYILHDTSFALSQKAGSNVRNALLVARIYSNKYDVPVGLACRFPTSLTALNQLITAYANMISCLEQGRPDFDYELAAAFMRLWEPDSTYLKDELFPQVYDWCVYVDTLGAVQMMQQISDMNIPAEISPSGHWAFPYGALNIHRRDDWMLSIKGWSKYVVDYEQSSTQNIYGRYICYGTTQILGSGCPENSLDSGYDTENGWDWNRWPGATIIYLPLNELEGIDRWPSSFNDQTFVGGVSLESSNGFFSMNFHDTVYNTSFRARKSVFCFGNKIICVGSNIENNDAVHPTETILFQNKLSSENAPIWINSAESITSFPYSAEYTTNQSVWLIDACNNGYYIPNAEGLNIVKQNQQSENNSGTTTTYGDFAVSWINHGTDPSDECYEYAIFIQTDVKSMLQFVQDPGYQVIQQDGNAHIVHEDSFDITCYSLFEPNLYLNNGIVKGSDVPCMVMIKNKPEGLVVSVCNPDFGWEPGSDASSWSSTSELYRESPVLKVRIELYGIWGLGKHSSQARIVKSTEQTTIIEFDCQDAKTIQVDLKKCSISDLSGDCAVNMEDFAIISSEWLLER